MKREILDELEAAHSFELPPSLVDLEFDNIWTQLENNLKATNKTFADEGKTEDEARAEYRGIAERRVRLGLVIGEIGEKNKLQVSQDEMRRALSSRPAAFPARRSWSTSTTRRRRERLPSFAHRSSRTRSSIT